MPIGVILANPPSRERPDLHWPHPAGLVDSMQMFAIQSLDHLKSHMHCKVEGQSEQHLVQCKHVEGYIHSFLYPWHNQKHKKIDCRRRD